MAQKDFSTYFDTGEYLFREGDRGEYAYIIESGSVEISYRGDDQDQVISILGEGDILGESVIIDRLTHVTSARAREPTRTVAIPLDYIGEKISDADPTIRLLLRLTLYRYRDAETRLRQVFQGITPLEEIQGPGSWDPGVTATGELKNVMEQLKDMQQRISTAVKTPAMEEKSRPGSEQTLLSTKILVTQDKSIKSAMEDEEFELYFQPIVELESEKIVGCEALIRWNESPGNILLPTQFIPRAEVTGMIIAMGYWIARKACQFQSELARRCRQAPFVSINLSGKQFEDMNLIDSLADIMDETNVVHEQIRFEITESLLMENPDLASEALRQLKQTGARLAIDDFGTGYSSFNYLHQFPFDTLKIDKTFVAEMSGNLKSNEIVKSLVHLSHDLGMSVVAEGIETNFQVDMLLQHGTDYGQGYYFSKAIPADEFMKLILGSP